MAHVSHGVGMSSLKGNETKVPSDIIALIAGFTLSSSGPDITFHSSLLRFLSSPASPSLLSLYV